MKSFLENINFCTVVVWYVVNRMIIRFSKHPFRQVAVILFIFSCLQNSTIFSQLVAIPGIPLHMNNDMRYLLLRKKLH